MSVVQEGRLDNEAPIVGSVVLMVGIGGIIWLAVGVRAIRFVQFVCVYDLFVDTGVVSFFLRCHEVFLG